MEIKYNGKVKEGVTIYNIAFNQSYDCFTVASNLGFAIYACNPYKLIAFRCTFAVHKEAFKGGIYLAQMIFKSNLLALVGTEENLVFPRNKIVIWDDCIAKPNIELALKSPVISVKLRKDMMAIATENCVFAYALADYKLLDVINTCANTQGVLALNCKKDYKVMACPHNADGSVRVQLYGKVWDGHREKTDDGDQGAQENVDVRGTELFRRLPRHGVAVWNQGEGFLCCQW